MERVLDEELRFTDLRFLAKVPVKLGGLWTFYLGTGLTPALIGLPLLLRRGRWSRLALASVLLVLAAALGQAHALPQYPSPVTGWLMLLVAGSLREIGRLRVRAHDGDGDGASDLDGCRAQREELPRDHDGGDQAEQGPEHHEDRPSGSPTDLAREQVDPQSEKLCNHSMLSATTRPPASSTNLSSRLLRPRTWAIVPEARTLPPTMIATESQVRWTSSMEWLESTTVPPPRV